MTDDERILILMIRCGHKTDPKIIYQQDPYTRMFFCHKLHENAKINFLKCTRFLGEFYGKK